MLDGSADGLPAGNVDRSGGGEPAIGNTGAGDTDAHAVLCIDGVDGLGGALLVKVEAGDMSSLLDETISGLAADATSCTDDRDDLACHLLLGGHALELGLLEEPVLDVKGLLLGQGDILVYRLGAAHDLDCAVVELRGDAALALVLAPRDHSQSGDEDDGRVRIAHRGGVRMLAAVVVGGVVGAVGVEAGGELGLKGRDILGLGIPVDVEGLDLRAEEVIRAGGAELGEAGGILGVHEAEDLLVGLDGADKALLLADLAAEPGKDGGEGLVTG